MTPLEEFLTRFRHALCACSSAQVIFASEICKATKKPYAVLSTSSITVIGTDSLIYSDAGDGNDMDVSLCAEREFEFDLQMYAQKRSGPVEQASLLLEDFRLAVSGHNRDAFANIGASVLSFQPIVRLDLDEGLSRAQTSFTVRTSLVYPSCKVSYIDKIELESTIVDVDDSIVYQEDVTIQ